MDEGPNERGSNNFFDVFVEPRTLYVSMRLTAFVLTYCMKHFLELVSGEILQNLERETYWQTGSERILSVASFSLHLLHSAIGPAGPVLSVAAMLSENSLLWSFFEFFSDLDESSVREARVSKPRRTPVALADYVAKDPYGARWHQVALKQQ